MKRHGIGIALVLILALVGGCGTTATSPQPAPAQPADSQAGQPAAPAEPAAAPKPVEVDFSGKNIELLVNYSAGGPTDLFNRMIANHLGRFLPGKPEIMVKNVAGAGGMVGANTIYASPKKDGTAIAGMSIGGIMLHPIYGDPGAQYDLTKFEWFGAAAEGTAQFARVEAGVKSIDDILTLDHQLVSGGLREGSSLDLPIRFLLDALGVDYRHVVGYPGVADIWSAMQSGELDLMGSSVSMYVPRVLPEVEKGIITPISQGGLLDPAGKLVRDPRIDSPTVVEATIDRPSGKAYWTPERLAAYNLLTYGRTIMMGNVLPPGTDPDVVYTYRQAYNRMVDDPQFQEAMEKLIGFAVASYTGEEAQQMVVTFYELADQNPAAVKVLQDMSK